MYKSIASSLVLSALMATSAIAADLSIPAAPAPEYAGSAYSAPSYDWTGFYAGVIGGYGFGENTTTSAGVSTVNGNIDGLFGGVTAGANMQYDQFVFGVEGDLALSGQSGDTTCAGGGTCASDFDWNGTMRGRAGIALDPVLVYATGGLAVARMNTSTPTGSYSDTYYGWTVGAGVEAAVTEQMSAKIEYNYADFGDRTAPAGTLNAAATTVSPTNHAVKAGINFHF